MIRATTVLPHGSWDMTGATDRLLIDFDRRHRRRLQLTTEAGMDVLLDLPNATRLRDGDGLQLDDGRTVAITARPEDLAEVRAHDEAGLTRIAWHLGNRHLPVQLVAGGLRMRRDHVIEAMVRLLGGSVTLIEAAFDPEAGAYASGHSHAHDDDHDHH